MKILLLLIIFIINVFVQLFFFLNPVFSDIKSILRKSIKVEILSPRSGERVRGKISIQAVVNYPEKVNYIEFYIQEPGAQDRYEWKAYSSPYFWGGDEVKLDTTLFNDGPASAVAFCHPKDTQSPVEQNRVHFTIDNGKPRIKILAPKDHANVSGDVQIQIVAEDLKGIRKEPRIVAVYVYVDGSLLQKLTKAPFKYTWSTCLVAPGLHSIKAVAEDSEGLNSSDHVILNVEGGPINPSNRN